MAGPAVRVEGLDELRRQLRRVKDRELDAEMKAIHLEIAREIGRRASPHVPRVSGKLWQSVRAAGTVRDAIGRVGSKSVPYAAKIHWGHGAGNIAAAASIAGGGRRGRATRKRQAGRTNVKGRPFLQDAARELERDISDRYERDVHRMLDRIVKDTLSGG